MLREAFLVKDVSRRDGLAHADGGVEVDEDTAQWLVSSLGVCLEAISAVCPL